MTDHETTTPQIEAILADLAEMCRASMVDNDPLDDNRAQLLVDSLKRNGWDRHASDQKPLRDQLRDRVFEGLPEHSHPRRGELDAMLSRIQSMYKSANQYETKLPQEDRREPVEPRDQAESPHTTLQSHDLDDPRR